ncbi:hypothetical protein M0P65_01675 [Candidatus Gracilibacteria bacterium]|nr:hypothetical protein [Candidatus Gracilibacteria bacterium]
MNTLENFEQERKTCSNIYEILAHPAIFKPLFSCIYQNFTQDDIDNIIVKIEKINFLKHESNLYKILDFFKDDINVKKFADEVEKFYLEHKEALDRVGINDSHKNAYSIAIATLRQFDDDKFVDNSKDNNHISIKLTQKDDIIKKVQDKFEEILSQIHSDYEIVGDIEGNLFNRNNIRYDHGEIYDFFDKKIMAFKKGYIDINTRKPILFNDNELCMIRKRTTLPNGEIVLEVEVKGEQIKMDKLMISETEEYKFEGKEVLGFGGIAILPNGENVVLVCLEKDKSRFITKENKIYKVLFEGVECEVCGLWGTETNYEGEKFRQATIIDKNGKKRTILILKHRIQKPKFTIFGRSFFIFNKPFYI